MIDTYEYDKIIGSIVTCLEDAANMAGHQETVDINRLYTYEKKLNVEEDSNVLLSLIKLRHKFVHNPYNFGAIHKILKGLSDKDAALVLCTFRRLCNMYYDEDRYVRDFVDLRNFIKENVNYVRKGDYYVMSIEEQKYSKSKGTVGLRMKEALSKKM